MKGEGKESVAWAKWETMSMKLLDGEEGVGKGCKQASSLQKGEWGWRLSRPYGCLWFCY